MAAMAGERDGAVLIEKYGVMAVVCGAGFGKKEADVTCRHLGYDNGDAVCCRPYGVLTWPDDQRRQITCQGNETSLHNCSHSLPTQRSSEEMHWWSSSTSDETTLCDDDDYAAVVCRNTTAPAQDDFELSISGPSVFTGRLELTYDGVKGVVCGDDWNQPAAESVCQYRGYNYGVNYTHVQLQDESVGPVWTANLSCSGVYYHSTAHCEHVPFGTVKSCVHHAAVLCYNDFNHANHGYPYYRLEPLGIGEQSNSGRVGVFIDGQWGTISANDSLWTSEDFDVLCRSLGFSFGTQGPSAEHLIQGSGHVWTVSAKCDGHESDPMHCRVEKGWTMASIQNHNDDLTVTCSHADMTELYW
ncbi:neurotrypsin-like [Babylonia areolata]|uniref:neurotrypsin-like n=1 Tax=Babylonia areolata TaxID=304850 RepID=UPI003FD05490